MTGVLQAYTWRSTRLDEAVTHLAERLGARSGPTSSGMRIARDAPADIPHLCEALGLDADAHDLHYGAVANMPAPGLVRLPADAGDHAWLVVGARSATAAVVLGLDGHWHRLPLAHLESCLHAHVDDDARRDVAALLGEAGIDGARHDRALRALLAERLADVVVADAWRVSIDAGGRARSVLREEGVFAQAAQLVTMHAAQFVSWIAAWVLIGRGALDGRTDWGWMTAWGLLIAMLVPLQVWTGWTQGTLALAVGRILKRRFLAGAMRLDTDVLRAEGAGRMLGRVLESGAVETLAVSGGLVAVMAMVELLISGWVLGYGAAGAWLVSWLAICVAGAALGGLLVLRRRGAWADHHLAMTHRMVERIAGHRTRLAQESPHRRHDDEDVELAAYTRRSRALDRPLPALVVGLPRAWTVGSLVLLMPAFAEGREPDALAIAIGGVLLAGVALRRCAEGLLQLAGAAIAWREARTLFAAAALPPAAAHDAGPPPAQVPVVRLRDVSYQYPGRAAPALRECSMRIDAGERVLVEGPSGGGKSTLAAIVAGVRLPTSGLVLAGGFDRASLGPAGWRKRVASAPQFHENHVFCETFAFNLLMGRRWPATADDLADAEAVARELGLGPLLERMPAGMMQMVGEGGWQLSHGERSRLFVARALLQGGDLVVLDESLAALDPETSHLVLDCVAARARSLMVIAHA